MTASATSPVPDPDDEIIRLMRDRQNIGLRTLLERYGGVTRRALRKTLGNALDDAEIDEAMSTASYNAWRAIDTYERGKGTLRAWFFVIARNAGRAILRTRQGRRWEPRSDAIATARADMPRAFFDEAEPDARQSAFLRALRASIARLPRLQRKVIEADLRSGDVADAEQLASELRTSKNSIYVSRNNARKKLRNLLGEMDHHFEEEQQP